MSLFSNKPIKNLYKIVWKFSSTSTDSYTEIVKADDVADAWRILKGEHSLPITFISCEEFYSGKTEKVT